MVNLSNTNEVLVDSGVKLVYFLLKTNCLFYCRGYSTVMLNGVQRKPMIFSVFEPLIHNLVSANLVFSYILADGSKVLAFIYIYQTFLLIILYFLHQAVALAFKPGNGFIEPV